MHLSAEAPEEDRHGLVRLVKPLQSIQAFGNVDVVGKPDRLTYMVSSNIAMMLSAAPISLKVDS